MKNTIVNRITRSTRATVTIVRIFSFTTGASGPSAVISEGDGEHAAFLHAAPDALDRRPAGAKD
jgi:hypothetical protein